MPATDLNGQLAAGALMAKHVLVAAGTQTAAGVDLKDFVGECKAIIYGVQGSAECAIVFSFQDSSDNSTFATFAGAPTPITTTAASLLTAVAIDTRNTKRYL